MLGVGPGGLVGRALHFEGPGIGKRGQKRTREQKVGLFAVFHPTRAS